MPLPKDDDEPANPVSNRDSRDAPNTREHEAPGDRIKGVDGTSPSIGVPDPGDGKASPEHESPVRSPRKPRKPTNPVPTVPTGAIQSLLAHCQKTCDAKRRGKHPWTYLENAVNDVKKWINEVL